MATKEVRNGSFVYYDTLFAEVGEGKRHPRASASELKDLLLPRKNALPVKDQVAHWYEAQLIHYGLPRVKDKNAAKMRLLGAVNAGSLKVPNNISQLEADLKKQYVSAQRKAKNAEKTTETVGSSGGGKKRKASDMEASQSSGSTTKMSFTIGEMTVNIDHASNSTSSKSSKKPKAAATATTKKAVPEVTPTKQSSKPSPAKATIASPSKIGKPATTKPSTTKPSTTKPSTTKSKPKPNIKVGNHPRTPQTARRSRPFNHSAGRSDTEPTRDPTPMSMCTDDEEDPPPPYTEYDSNEDGDNESDKGYAQTSIQISGAYTITTAYADNAELLVRLSHARDQLWGSFTLASKTGIIRLDNIDNIASSVRKSFGWRSEDDDTGHLRFGKGCDGWIEFDSVGGVSGTFYGLREGHDVYFEGGLQEHYGNEDEEEREEAVASWAHDWHEFPERAYGRR